MLPGRHHVAGLLGLGLLLGLLSLTVSLTANTRETPPADGPTLAVLVYIDQLRGDFLTRWDDLFGEGGFHRLEKEGAWFQNCHYPYAETWTAVGHTSVAAGCAPDRHGIIDNEWFDRQKGVEIYCVDSERYPQVPPLPTAVFGQPRTGIPAGVSPERLLAPTLADALKEATGGKGRVVSLSLKDRSAVLPAGRRPDACYWLDTGTGTFFTSTYYRDQLHPWVAQCNHSGAADRWWGTDWTRLRPDLDYDRYSGPDDGPGESTGILQGRTFPHPMGGFPRPRAAYYGALYNSPFGNDLLLGLAQRAIEAEKLGQSGTRDLLYLSFSSNDAVGHSWGPDSHEVLDTTLRTDQIVAQLLQFLDSRVGKGRYILVLTADHGVCPLPERMRQLGHDAGRIDPLTLTKKAEAFLRETFQVSESEGRWIEPCQGHWLYLNLDLLQRRQLKQEQVEEALAGWLKKQPGIQTAYTRTQLLAGIPADDVMGQRVKRSFYPERSGNVRIVPKPYYLLSTRLTGTNHGTGHPYDTHVPLLVYGPGVRAGVRRDAVTPLSGAAILAQALGIKPPARATVALPPNLLSPR